MSNVTLAFPDDLLERARAYAQRQGTTLNQLIRESLQRRVQVAGCDLSADEWIAEVARLSVVPTAAPPWTWNREEIYERDPPPAANRVGEMPHRYEAAREEAPRGRTFLDTNLLFYAHDARDPTKQAQARAYLANLRERGDGVLSTQVLNELSSILLRKLLFPPAQVKALLALYGWAEVVVIRPPQIEDALDLVASHQLSYWDALMVSAALAANCTVLASEDLARARPIRSLHCSSPFA